MRMGRKSLKVMLLGIIMVGIIILSGCASITDDMTLQEMLDLYSSLDSNL